MYSRQGLLPEERGKPGTKKKKKNASGGKKTEVIKTLHIY